MPNNPSQDTYNPAGIGSEFEEHYFSELNEGEIFRIHDNNNTNTEQFRKENENEIENELDFWGDLYGS